MALPRVGKIGPIGKPSVPIKAPKTLRPLTSLHTPTMLMNARINLQTVKVFHAVVMELSRLNEMGKHFSVLTPESVLVDIKRGSAISAEILSSVGKNGPYSAPLGEKQHIYSLGLIFYETLAGKSAFSTSAVTDFEREAFNLSLVEKVNPELSKRTDKDSWAWDILAKMTATDPAQRISAEELMSELFYVHEALNIIPQVDAFGRPLQPVTSLISEKQIGQGGTATAYLIEAKLGDQTIKIIRKKPRLIGVPSVDQRAIQMIYSEYESMPKPLEAGEGKKYYSPYLVEAYRLGEETVQIDGVPTKIPFIDMEYVNGVSLQKFVDGELPPLGLEQVLEIAFEAGEGLLFLHEQGHVHRDIKPENIMRRNADGRTKILDFGTVKFDLPKLTYESIEGTPGFMSPEQIYGKSDKRSDIYAFGQTILALLLGREAVEVEYENNWPVFDKLFESMLRSPALIDTLPLEGMNAEAQTKFRNILKKMTAMEVEERYQDMIEVLNDLLELKMMLV